MPAIVERASAVLTVTIEGRNAVNPVDHQTYVGVARALQEIDDRPDIRCGILRGAGDLNFCAGGDMREIREAGEAAMADPRAEISAMFEAYWFPHLGPHDDTSSRTFYFREHAMNYRRRTLSPVIAAVNGWCLGAGLILMLLHSSQRIAGRSARFGMAEIKLGMSGGLALSDLQHQVSGRGVALLLSGEPIDAETALDIGLINEVVDDDAVFERARVVAESIAARPRLSALAEKQAMIHAADSPSRRAAWGALARAMRVAAESSGVGEAR